MNILKAALARRCTSHRLTCILRSNAFTDKRRITVAYRWHRNRQLIEIIPVLIATGEN